MYVLLFDIDGVPVFIKLLVEKEKDSDCFQRSNVSNGSDKTWDKVIF